MALCLSSSCVRSWICELLCLLLPLLLCLASSCFSSLSSHSFSLSLSLCTRTLTLSTLPSLINVLSSFVFPLIRSSLPFLRSPSRLLPLLPFAGSHILLGIKMKPTPDMPRVISMSCVCVRVSAPVSVSLSVSLCVSVSVRAAMCVWLCASSLSLCLSMCMRSCLDVHV